MGGVPAEPGHPLPMFISPKLDGIRCVIIDGIAYSRNLKPIRNQYISASLHGLPPLDGEIIVGPPNHPDVWNASNSGVMSGDGEPDFTFYVFDWIDLTGRVAFKYRFENATRIVEKLAHPGVKILPHGLCETYERIQFAHTAHLDMGYEGSMLRSPDGPYKQGKSTANEGFLLKMKQWYDSEAVVLSVTPLFRNTNEATISELGLQKRSKHKAGMVAENRVGKLTVRDLTTGEEFDIGSGLDDKLKKEYWKNHPIGKIMTYKHLGLTVNRKPRHPIYKGLRDAADMDPTV